MNLFEIRNKLNSGINLNDIELRVTYYSRVSTDSKEQKTSLENQNSFFTTTMTTITNTTRNTRIKIFYINHLTTHTFLI